MLPHDSSFFLMQSMGHAFSAELAANNSARKPASADSAASRSSFITCHATVSGFCLMVLRVLCPLITSAATFAPQISLKLLLAGKLPFLLPPTALPPSCPPSLHHSDEPACSCGDCRVCITVS